MPFDLRQIEPDRSREGGIRQHEAGHLLRAVAAWMFAPISVVASRRPQQCVPLTRVDIGIRGVRSGCQGVKARVEQTGGLIRSL